MARRLPAVTYRQAMVTLEETYRTLTRILELRLSKTAREQLVLLKDVLAIVVRCDNGRGRRR
jgi:hypothetical protein